MIDVIYPLADVAKLKAVTARHRAKGHDGPTHRLRGNGRMSVMMSIPIMTGGMNAHSASSFPCSFWVVSGLMYKR